MSEIRFNRWSHQSGTGGIYQNSSGSVGIGTSIPSSSLDIQGGDLKIGNYTLSSNSSSLNVNGDITVAGTLTYEDVTNIDSVGIITAQSGIHVTGGSVGIGTDNPVAPLNPHGTAALTNAAQTVVITDSNVDDAEGRGGNLGFSGYVNGSLRTLAAIGGLKTNAGNSFNGDLALYTRTNGQASLDERLRITSSGNVGIGTDNPTDKLHVYSSGANTISTIDSVSGDAGLQLRNSGDGNWSGINFIRERSTGTNVTGGSIWMPSVTANNSALLYIQTQSASANAGADGALVDNNGVRLKLASQPNGVAADTAFSVEVGSQERLRIDSSGRVGIATDTYSNGEMLVVDSVNGNASYNSRFVYSGTSNTAYCASTWRHGESSTAVGYAGVGGSNVNNTSFRNSFVVGTQNNTALSLNTNDARRFVIDGSGNAEFTGTGRFVIRKDNSGGLGAYLSLQNRLSATGTQTGISFGVDNSDAIPDDGTDWGNGQITVTNDGTNGAGIMEFKVHDGSNNFSVMKMVGDGARTVSTNNVNTAHTGGVAFGRAGVSIDRGWENYPGIMVMNTSGGGDTNQGELRIHGWNRAYSNYPAISGSDFSVNLRIDGATYFGSDRRHKTNIVDNPYGLNEILQLQPRKFNRINSNGDIETDKGDILGFIAQEVVEVIPEAVKYYPDEDIPNEIGWCRAYALNDTHIVSTLVNAVKELSAKNDALEARIAALEGS